jgi:hypothetical protein
MQVTGESWFSMDLLNCAPFSTICPVGEMPVDQAKECDPNHSPRNSRACSSKAESWRSRAVSFRFMVLCRKLPTWFPPAGKLSYRQVLVFFNNWESFHPRRRSRFQGRPAAIPLEVHATDAQHSRPRRVELRRNALSGHLGVTQSCDLACKHCRAAAQPIAHPDELTNAEGKALIDQIAEMHVPIFVFHRRRPAEAQGRLRADPLRRRTKACR